MKITQNWLEKHHACRPGLAWFKKQRASEHQDVVRALVECRRLDWALWLCAHMLLSNPANAQTLNLYAARLVAPIFRKTEKDKDLRHRFSKMLDDIRHARYALANRKAAYLIRHCISYPGAMVVSAFCCATRLSCLNTHQAFWALDSAMVAAYYQDTSTCKKVALNTIKRGLKLIDEEAKHELVKPRHRH